MRLDHLLSRVLEQSPSRETLLHSFVYVPYGDEALDTEYEVSCHYSIVKEQRACSSVG